MKLLIFTSQFPYGTADRFIEEELKITSCLFETISIVPLQFGTSPEDIAQISLKNVKLISSLLPFTLGNKVRLFTTGVFSFATVAPFVKEFFVKKVFLHKKWFMNWLSSTCITRALLTKKRFGRVISMIDRNTVLYFYWGDKSSGIVPFLRKRLNNPIVVRFHGSDLYEEAKGGYQPYRLELLKNLTTAIPISEMGYRYLKNHYHVGFNCKVSRLGVPDRGINPYNKSDVFRIVTCSNVVKIKRLHLLIEALKLVDFKIYWLHIGDGPLLSSVKEASSHLRTNISAEFKGWIPSSARDEIYRSTCFDLFLNVSETEGIPVSIMEALSFGIPVIATDVGGVSEIVNDEIGKLIKKDISAEELAFEIKKFSKISDVEKLRSNCRRMWETNYNSTVNYYKFAEYLKSLLHMPLQS